MGAHIVGWRDCSSQIALKRPGFLRMQKLRVLRDLVDVTVPTDERTRSVVNLTGAGRPPETISYPELVAALGDFDRGVPECGTCPMSRKRPVGCHAFVAYPVDEFFEQRVFEYFVTQLSQTGSPAAVLAQEVLPNVPSAGTDWHTRRGPEAEEALATLPKPLVHSLGGWLSKRRVDSAQLLAVLFQNIEDPGWVTGMFLFLLSFYQHASRLPGSDASRTFKQVGEALSLYAGAAGMVRDGVAAKIVIDG
jgi:hypothetical protein